MQDTYAKVNVPLAILRATENINPNECMTSLGMLVKLMIPEHAHNELFARQYIQVHSFDVLRQHSDAIVTTLKH